ncbi:hypothetical protein SAMN04515673_11941 [Poseidonocella sedimentorum]|uniref:Uncharacterized protein n=1 Tax=Poseidonocella sedimentorum TaxID=871652 RepID=A0A1I6ER54_9RHOB|nr:hypothetical protein SAMN04515673_11941 [Poseidonocella sedimentorum]
MKLRMLLRGNAKPGKHEADADHLFEAGKYGGGYFLTHDKRIHKLVDQIKKIIPSISVVTLKEFVEIALFYENANSPNP